jgi:hypothetical protein
MTYQSNFHGYTAFLVQSALGTQASGSGGQILRQAGGTPGKLSMSSISSKEIRQDAQPARGRHGMQATVGGPYTGELSIGSWDAILQALLRGTWDTEISATSADFTSLTYGANSIVWNSGNPITKGFRVNDVIELTTAEDAGNASRDIRITGISATTITTAETLTVDATADTTAVLKRRGRKVIMPPAGSLVNRYFTIEEYESDLAQGRVFTDCFWKTAKISMTPNNLVMFEPSWIGTGAMTVNASTPILTTPTLPTSVPMAVVDATLRLGGNDIADISSFDLTIENGAVAPAVVGSKLSPTVMPGMNQVSMSLKILQKDMSWVSAFLGETGFSLSLLAVDNSAQPKNFISINVPNFTLGSADLSAMSSAGGPRDITISVPAALVGHDTTGSGYDDTAMSIQISNNS